MGRRGRPAKSGARYPSGKLKPVPRPGDDPLSPVAIQRLFRDAKALGIDQRLASQVGRLLLLRELTAFQAAVAFRIAAVYARFEREHGKRRSVRSPSYELSYGNGPLWDDLNRFGEDAQRDFFSLQKAIRPDWRDAIEQLCVDDRAISSLALNAVRGILEEVGETLDMTRPGRATKSHAGGTQRGGLPLHFNNHEDVGDAPAAAEGEKPQRKVSIDELFWVETMARLRPDIERKDLVEEYRFTTALKDRTVRERKLASERRPDRVPRSRLVSIKLNRPLLTIPPKKEDAA